MPFTYSVGFPVANDTLGGTRARFFQNTQSVKDFVDVNHYTFSDPLAGNHKWSLYGRETVNFPNTNAPVTDSIAIYGSLGTVAKQDQTRTQLWFQPSGDATGDNA